MNRLRRKEHAFLLNFLSFLDRKVWIDLRNLTEEEKEEENEKKNKIDRFKERKWFKRFFSLIWQVPRDLPD